MAMALALLFYQNNKDFLRVCHLMTVSYENYFKWGLSLERPVCSLQLIFPSKYLHMSEEYAGGIIKYYV